jgi:subtilisin family serine protease
MKGGEKMSKEYPKEFKVDGIRFKKSPDELYLELSDDLSKMAVDSFLNEKSKTIEWRFEPKDRKILALQKFNKFAVRSKWVTRAKERKESIDELIGEIESDNRVRMAGPVYYREDLGYPNGFTFDDQIIIKHDKTTLRMLLPLFQKLGVEKVEGSKGTLGTGLTLLRILDGKKQNVYEIAQKLAQSELIKSARVNMIQLHSAIDVAPNDTYFLNQWNLRNTGQIMSDGNVATPGCDINVEPAWNISRGSPLVVIAVLDTGIDMSHEDLLLHLVQRDRWYNAATGTNSPDDDVGHGTCCAGIASALTNSLASQGVAGVGWHCRIMPIRMVWNNGYGISEAAILNALNWARNHHARIISMSWHYDGSQTNIDTALQTCFNAGIVLVAASGNYAPLSPDVISYPARNSNVIAVGATNENDRRCRGGINQDWPQSYQGSQYGPELSVVAPGVHTWSSDMNGLGQGYNSTYGGGDAAGDYYEDFGGTSGATPHVAGLAGLLLAFNPTLTPTQIRNIIENTADDMVGDTAEDTAGWDKYMGHGRINAHAALVNTQTNHPFSPADVYIRDALTDTGTEPYIGYPLCYSPDIIIRKNPVANPQTAFANMATDPGSDKVEIGNDNYIYIRVHNKGNINSDIHARVYFAPLNTTCSPNQWTYIGQIDFYDIPAGGHAVSDALVWKKVPDPGTVDHFCIIASIEGFRDPHPDPTGISNASQYMDFIRNSNNIGYRNLVFEDVLPNTSFPLNFVIAGLVGSRDIFDLRIEREGPAMRAKVDLKLPKYMFMEARARIDNVVEAPKAMAEEMRTFELREEKRSAIKNLVMQPGIRGIAQLEVKIPDDAESGEVYQIAVQQLFNDEVIGDFQFIGRVMDPKETKFIAVRGTGFVHKANCKGLAKTDKQLWAPFSSLEDAISGGYDMALDCLNQSFTAKNVSSKLARKVLNFVNNVELAEDLDHAVKDTLGIGYYKGRYGAMEAKRVGYGLGIGVARKILEAREKVGRFTKLSEIEAVKGVGIDTFIDLVNVFKQ